MARRSDHPLGPRLVRTRPEEVRSVRRAAAARVAFCGALLGVALLLRPAPDGFGTHAQLGLPRCSMITRFGIPCPTCGMTTSFAHAVRGQWVAAFQAQPFGLLLALGTIATLLFSIGALATGRAWRINWYRLSPARVLLASLALALAAWGYKILATVGVIG